MSNANGTDAVASVALRFSSSAYSLDTIKKAAYRFLDRFATDFRTEGDEIVCQLFFLKPVAPDAAQLLIAAFRTETLDQDLRERIAKETSGLRNTILALAFSKSELVRDE
jgi:His-Xaa-Ser system protein HxsD